MRFVFDLDDTISRHRNRDFANAEPIQATVRRMRGLKEDGHEIVIYTARGQNSCGGDLRMIEEKYRGQITEWLQENDVPCDELIFGKPLGDVYIDDKGISLEDFYKTECVPLRGNSGGKIYRLGGKVVKFCSDARAQGEWYETAREIGLDVPDVFSVVLDSITMEYIDGEAGYARNLSRGDVNRLLMCITQESDAGFSEGWEFDTAKLIERAEEHLKTAEAQHDFHRLFSFLEQNRKTLASQNTFCHGDLSLSNVIFVRNAPYFIDPIVKPGLSSYLMDFAKLRFSCDGGEGFLHGPTARGNTDARAMIDEYTARFRVREFVIAIEATYWIRLLKYVCANESGQERRDKIFSAVYNARRLEAMI